MTAQEMTLNVRYDLPEDAWFKVASVYEKCPGWLGFGDGAQNGERGIPYWFSYNEDQKHILASVEPGGLQFTAIMADDDWEEWSGIIKKLLTEVLGFKIGEIEKGEVD